MKFQNISVMFWKFVKILVSYIDIETTFLKNFKRSFIQHEVPKYICDVLNVLEVCKKFSFPHNY